MIKGDMEDNLDYKDGQEFGEMKSDIKTLAATCARIETSVNRFGERTGMLEEKHGKIETSIEVLKAQAVSALEDVKDLKGSRKWFITAIVGGFLAALWKVVATK